MILQSLSLAAALALVPVSDHADAGRLACEREVAEVRKELEAERERLTWGANREIGEWLDIAGDQCSSNIDYARDTLRIVREMLAASRPSGAGTR